MNFLYLGLLLFSLVGMWLIDWKFKLALAKNIRYICPILVAVVFFLAWDIAGISQGIFFRGDSEHLSGILIGPELPLEEVFFLALLNYTALIFIRVALKRWPK
jgi:lycopene cyclase domain-containing protein